MKHYCVISHTHWDREWYQTQEEFRMRLIDLMDHLLKILDTYPDYIFHMDAQTIVFEDYWEIRPEMREKCCQYIREGRILAGPWYVQNDFFLTSGEATVRNLLIGMRKADEMGGCAKTGYTPDQFGLISQLPQILKGFGMDHCIFGRGYGDFKRNEAGELLKDEAGELIKKHKPAEFIWKSPDGSEVLAICMSYWYNNAQRFSADIDRAYHLTKNIEAEFEGVATTPYLLLMNGVDHLEPQPDLLPILKEVQKRLPENEKIYQTTMEHYAELVRSARSKDAMWTQTGELMEGDGTLKDTASSRVYLKRKNFMLQNLLENCLEPLYTWMELSGMKGVYPAGHLDYLWKMLIRNHAHDSICGCSTDRVHRHMEDRFLSIEEMGRELQRRGMKQLAVHVTEGVEKDDYLIVVFNALEQSRTEVVDVIVDIVAEDHPVGLNITSPDGEKVPFLIKKEYSLGKSVFTAINLPGTVDTKRYEIRLLAENVPAFGYAAYRVQTGEKTKSDEKFVCLENTAVIVSSEGQEYCLENSCLKAVVQSSGKINLLHKESGHCYEDVLTVQDVADLGDVYNFIPLENDVPVDIAGLKPEITVEESDIFTGRVRIHYEVTLPAAYDFEHQKRSEETITMPLTIFVGLKAGDTHLELNFKFENRAKDHRMRVLIRSGLNSDVSTASAPYDLISRNKWDINTQICTETEHTSGSVTIGRDNVALSVLNRGVYGFENLQKEQGTLAFTLVRANGVISGGGVVSDDDAWKVPENQCLREIECDLALMPWQGEHPAEEAVFAAKEFQNPLMVQCEPVDSHKFMGGRPAVQDTEIAEFFYQDPEYADVKLERRGCGFFLEGQGMQVTAWKKSHDKTGYIFRFFNAKDESETGVLHLGKFAIEKVWKTNLKETERKELEITDHTVCLTAKAIEIVTLFLETKNL